MPTREELMIALKKADAAGDEAGAQRIAEMIKEQRGNSALGVRPAQPQAQSRGRQISDVDAQAQKFLDSSGDMLSGDMLRQARRRFPGQVHEVRKLGNGQMVLESYSDPMAKAAADSQARRENKSIAQQRRQDGRAASALNGVSLTFGDEIAGALGADDFVDHYQGSLDYHRENHPVEAFLTEAATGVATGTPLVKGAQKLIGVSRISPGIGGATAGAVYGLGDARGGLTERLDDAAIGAAAGVVLGKSVEGVGAFASKIKRGIDGEKTVGEAARDEFGIRMSKGQASGDARQIAFENQAAADGKSEEAGRIMRPFFDRQKGDVIQAGKTLVGNQGETLNETGSIIREGVKRRAKSAKAEVDRLYDVARSSGAKMKAEGVEAMPDGVRAGLDDEIRFLLEGSPEQARQSIPVTSAALEAVDRLKSDISRANGAGKGRVTALDFRRIETARQAINGMFDRGMKDQDKRGLTQVKNAFDAYIDGAVDKALFEGDEAFLTAYQRARSSRADFARRFEENKFLEKIVKNDASPEETVEYIFGMGTKINPRAARKAIPQLKKVLGEDSPEWEAVKEAMLKKVMAQTEKTYNPKVLRDNLDELLTGKLQSVSQEAFTPEEYARLRRFRTTVERLIPPEGTKNYSGSATEIMRSIKDEGNRLFNFRGGATMRAVMNKFLPDRDAALAMNAVSNGAIGSAPRTALPAASLPVAAIASDRGVDRFERLMNGGN